MISGCSTGDDASSSSSPSPSVAQSSIAQSPTATQSFSKPLVAEKNATKNSNSRARVAGLLQSTEPLERARQVQARINKKGQKDPFSGLPPVLSFNLPASNAPAQSQNNGLPSLPTFPVAPEVLPSISTVATTSSGGTVSGRTVSRGTASRGLSAPKPVKPAIAALPPLPLPTLAEAVEVSGVIVVSGVPQAIVKAPNESTSRYVGAGQRLSNGQILVKRIEMNGGSDPLVILEQNGVEVSRGVGEKATPTQGTPTAMMRAKNISQVS